MKHIVRQLITKGKHAGKTLRAEMGWVYVATTQMVDTDLDDFVIKLTRNYRGEFSVSGVQFGVPTQPIAIKANIPRKDWQMTAGEAMLKGFSFVRIMR